MSRAYASRSGRSGNPKVAGSSLDLTVFKPWSSQTNDFKIDRAYLSLPSPALSIIRIGQGLVGSVSG